LVGAPRDAHELVRVHPNTLKVPKGLFDHCERGSGRVGSFRDLRPERALDFSVPDELGLKAIRNLVRCNQVPARVERDGGTGGHCNGQRVVGSGDGRRNSGGGAGEVVDDAGCTRPAQRVREWTVRRYCGSALMVASLMGGSEGGG